MKKNILIIVLAVVVFAAAIVPMMAGAFTPREELLKVYNWAEYISPEVLDGFSDYYYSVTGKKIRVQMDLFSTNEVMLNQVAISRADYDVICPSDYIIEKMRTHDLLVKLADDLGNDVNGEPIEDHRGNISPLCKSTEDRQLAFDPNNEYCRTYMWGTIGLLYNVDAFAGMPDANDNGHPDIIESWDILWDPAYAVRAKVKDSIRDTFAVGAIYTYKDKIREAYAESVEKGQEMLTYVLNDGATTDEALPLIKQNLIDMKKNINGLEVDEGKQDLLDGRIDVSLQWGGDAIWAIQEAAEYKEPKNLSYYVPNEGSNIFYDGWCIPKYARNVDAAQLFINYMCMPEVAVANMDYIGYSTAVASQEVMDYLNETYSDYDPVDLSYFFRDENGVPLPGADAVCADIRQFPEYPTIERCAVMRDYGKKDTAVANMWAEFKGSGSLL